jgi:hypothetical protein
LPAIFNLCIYCARTNSTWRLITWQLRQRSHPRRRAARRRPPRRSRILLVDLMKTVPAKAGTVVSGAGKKGVSELP